MKLFEVCYTLVPLSVWRYFIVRASSADEAMALSALKYDGKFGEITTISIKELFDQGDARVLAEYEES